MQENQIQGKRHKKKRKKSENSILAGSILLCIVTLTAITICLVMVFQYRALQQKNTETMNELETIRLEEEASYSQDEVDALIETAVKETEEKTGEEVSSLRRSARRNRSRLLKFPSGTWKWKRCARLPISSART